MSQKINKLTDPNIHHYVTPVQAPVKHHQVWIRSRKEISVAVVCDIAPLETGGYVVRSAVQYDVADTWYPKDTRIGFTFENALKIAYGLSRKLYHVTASRALAGLLHDSIVPATDDIDC